MLKNVALLHDVVLRCCSCRLAYFSHLSFDYNLLLNGYCYCLLQIYCRCLSLIHFVYDCETHQLISHLFHTDRVPSINDMEQL